MAAYWGIDLGGTKIEGAVVRSLEPLDVACRIRIPTEAEGGYDQVLHRISLLVARLAAESSLPRPPRVGIGTPGTTDPATGLLKNSNTTCLNGRPLQADLQRALGAEIAMANDANSFALAEATLGAAQGAQTVFGVILGTGVGGGLVLNGRVWNGAHGIAGEWGHNVVDPEGELCYCGRRGCVETVLSGPALERHYRRLSGREIALPEIVRVARGGADPAAMATLERLCEGFGRCMAVVVNVVDPEAIVLGGGVGSVDELLTNGRDHLRQWVFHDSLHTRLLKPALGDSAGVFGACLLAR